MKIEYKSMILGVLLGLAGCFVILLLLGNIESEFSFTTGNKPKELNKNILRYIFLLLITMFLEL